MKYHQPYDSTDPNAGYVNGNPSVGIDGSIPPAAMMEFPQRELVNASLVAGLTPSDTCLTQLAEAMSIGIFVGTFTGTANALTATIPGSVALDALQTGMVFHGVVSASPNTAAATLGLTGFVAPPGAQAIKQLDGVSALLAGDLPANALLSVRWDGYVFRVIGLTPSGVLAITKTLTGARTYYVNAATGSDANTGLTTTTAFATIQAAVNKIAGFNLNGFSVSVVVADGNYGPLALPATSGSGSVTITGNVTAPANCFILNTAGNAIICAGGSYTMNGFKVAATGDAPGAPNNSNGILAVGTGTQFSYSNFEFGVCTGCHVSSDQARCGPFAGTIKISGGARSHYNVGSAGSILSSSLSLPTLVISTAVTFSVAFAVANYGLLATYFTGITGASNVTGSKFSANQNGVISAPGLGVNYFPGTTAGTTSTGGQYIS